MQTDNRRAIGAAWESKALEILLKKGYKLIARNIAGKGYEIDIILLDPQHCQIVFLEVRTRSNSNLISVAHSLHSRKKQRALRRGARSVLYRLRKGEFGAIHFTGVRFDVMTNQSGEWTHFLHAFTV